MRDAYEDLRELPFILYYGTRGVMLDNSEFGSLAEYLHTECNWPSWEITTKLKHYEGWDDHDWTLSDGL